MYIPLYWNSPSRSLSAELVNPRRLTQQGFESGIIFSVHQYFVEFVSEWSYVLEASVNRSKSNICNIVNVLELAHYHLAYLLWVNFIYKLILKILLNLNGDILKLAHGNRALLAGSEQTSNKLGPVKSLPAAVAFNYNDRKCLANLIWRKPPVAAKALSSSSYTASFIRRSGIDDFAVKSAAEWTFHIMTSQDFYNIYKHF